MVTTGPGVEGQQKVEQMHVCAGTNIDFRKSIASIHEAMRNEEEKEKKKKETRPYYHLKQNVEGRERQIGKALTSTTLTNIYSLHFMCR